MRLSFVRVLRPSGWACRLKKSSRVGGGNTAVEEALFLTNFASEVTVIHRRDEFKAERILQERLFKHPKIKVKWHTTLDEVLGTDEPRGVTSVRLKNVQSGATDVMDVDGVFIAIGHKPATELFVDQLAFKNGGYLVTAPWSTQTEIPGVFAAGDVTDDIYRQAVTAAGMGCMAALEAEKYLHANHAEQKQAAE
jgi:thioredoxin reductase (NADPH)